MGGDAGEKKRPPYAKYAFHNLYNYSLLGAAGALAVVTGTWIPLALAAGLEAVWMVNAPGSRLLRKLWFDKKHAEEEHLVRKARREAAIGSLPVHDLGRAKRLEEKHEQIFALAENNKSFAGELLAPELAKLDRLVDGFIELAVNCARFEQYLSTIDWHELEHELRRSAAAA